jgi:hypothetical protein
VEKGIISFHCQESNPDSSAVKPISNFCTDCLNEQVTQTTMVQTSFKDEQRQNPKEGFEHKTRRKTQNGKTKMTHRRK